MTKKVTGHIEIDADRGVIYFHADDAAIRALKLVGPTLLRIQGLPTPIPDVSEGGGTLLDIRHPGWCDWSDEAPGTDPRGRLAL